MLGLLGCPTAEPAADAIPLAPDGRLGPDAPEATTAAATMITSEGEAADVALAFAGVSPLYQGYFSTEEWVAQLAKDLGSCFDGLVEVVISYDSEQHIGRILASVGTGTATCVPAAGPTGIELSNVAPIGRALAQYRDTVANARDLRIGSFRIGLRTARGTNLCDLYWGGQFPPDGSTMSPCVTLQGHEVCLGDRHGGITELPWPRGDAAEILRACFR